MTVLFVDRGAAEQVQSITAGMALCQALVISVASKMKKRSSAVLNEIDSMEKFALSPSVSTLETSTVEKSSPKFLIILDSNR
jgi:hypothetical protein